MSYANVSPGKNPPDDVNAIIEIPANSAPVKYEIDKETNTLMVDRFLSTAMFYPCNYGYIPQTLSDDGDPLDLMVLTPEPLVHGSVIRCRPVGMLMMTDEAGIDAKILAVPVSKLTKRYDHVLSMDDLPRDQLAAIEHFFEQYKALESNKWVKVEGWKGLEVAQKEIMDGINRYKEKSV
ncbi:MAG: ppa [Gammaproteobacteria bacterium]|nr:ppa [Gammaproteobacteria bacterium]